MLVYIVILLLLVYLFYVYDLKKETKRKNLCFGIVFIILVLLAGLRYHIGVDSYRYEIFFNDEIPNVNYYFRFKMYEEREPLWSLFMSIIKTFTNSFVAFQFVHAIILNLLIFTFIRKTTDKWFTALLFTYCSYWMSFNFEVLRESLCIGLFLHGLLLLNKHKVLLYVLFALIAIGVHRFSFVMFITAPLIVYLNYRLTYAFLIALVVFILFFMSDSMLKVLLLLSVDNINDEAAMKLESYIEGTSSGGFRTMNIFGYIKVFVVQIALPLMLFLFSNDSKKNHVYKKMMLLFVVINLLSIRFVIFYRLLNYIGLFIVVFSVNMLYSQVVISNTKRYFILIGVLFFLSNKISGYLNPSPLEYRPYVDYDCRYIPYKTIFEEPDPIRESLFRGL